MVAKVTLANVGTAEIATLSRDLLAPVAGQLSGDLPGLWRRCVLAQARHLGFFGRPGDVCTDLAATSGDDVEAVAICKNLRSAVVVFRTPAGATAALWRDFLKKRAGLYTYSPVPPLYLAFPSCFIQPQLVEFTLYPPTPSAPASGEEASTSTTAAEPSKRPWSWTFVQGPPGSSEFMPFLQGPRLGEDGHMWVDGVKFTYYENGMQIDNTSTRIVQFPSVL